jgi:O-antigen/teichoic acid export membrane protein
MSGFRAKIFNSAKLSSLKFLSEIGLRLISTVVLTRLLDPSTYGVFAIVMVYLYLLQMVSDIGLRTLILTKEDEVDGAFLNSFWTVSILRGTCIAIFSALIAGVIGMLQGQGVFSADSSYTATELPWVIVTLGLSSMIAGFSSPVRFLDHRNMKFGKVTVVAITVNTFGLVVTIGLAYYLRSIWALAFGAVLKEVLFVVLSFLCFRGPPLRPYLRRADFDVMIGRGKWIVGQSILAGLSRSADRLMLGFVMTSSSFGFYFIARQLADIVLRFLQTVDGQIGLQVFSHLHKSTTAEFRRNYYRYRLFFDAVAGMSTGGLIVLAPVIVHIVFDDRYQGVAPIMQTLVWAVLLSGPLLLRSAFYAERRFKEMTMLTMVSTATLWIGLTVSIFVFDSIEIAIMVIALHRLPEAMIYIIWGGERDWVIIWREFLGFVFCVLGALIGLGLLALWNILT